MKGMTEYAGVKVIINETTTWGETWYSISAFGNVQRSKDRAQWEAAVQQLRDAGAEIIDNAAKRRAEQAAIAEMRARMAK